ncbi:unnamed protein product [Oppiella nova]|uniref:Laminin G domain-containing protein n=1 Tax=Oppiella nova TaxID=334625 RepID=A0A7R9QWI7_9ACAR|nr:unnamed protein product [Oppiella nova]CAG2178204.1 unnamed protein product [Oppiella nova]
MFSNKPNSNQWPEIGIDGQKENRFEVRLLARGRNGIVVWLSKGATTDTDYLSLAVVNGSIELSFNLGAQKDLLFARSDRRVDDHRFHSVLVHRTERAATLRVDDDPPVTVESEAGANRLDTDGVLWIGGSPGLPTGLPPHYYSGFDGCVEWVRVDGEPLPLWSHSTASRLEFC